MSSELKPREEGRMRRRGMSLATMDEMAMTMEPLVVEQAKHISTLTSAMGDYEHIECFEIITIEIRR